VALFTSKGLWAVERHDGQIEVECPWAHEHTTGDDTAYIKAADPEAGLFPTFFCFHNHCEGRTFEDVLEHFGKRAVDRHCGERFAGRRTPAAPKVIDPANPMETARRYREADGGTLVHHLGEWRRWDGRKYACQSDPNIRAGVWRWLEECQQESKGVVVPYRPSTTAVNGVLDALRAVANVPSSLEMPCWLDERDHPAPEDIIAFANGLLDLDRFLKTGEARLLSHTPRWFSDNCLPHDFVPGAQCPAWIDFLDQVFEADEERIRALAQWFGYNMTADISLHKFALLIGPPRSGKGTTLRVLTHLLGTANVANPTFTSLGGRFGLAPLVNKLAALVGEGHLGRQSDAVAILERLKSISGGDLQNVDRKGKAELANVQIKARFTIGVNELPRFPDASAALRSRLLVIPFDVSFEGKEDFGLGERLLSENSGITNWALDGLLDLRRSGRLFQPRAGMAILDDFARLSSPVRAFLEDCCQVGPGFEVRSDVLREEWEQWCQRHGHEPGGDSKFGASLRAADPRIERIRRREEGRQPYFYKGVRLFEGR
jgi:putative DNA primase/helicase